MTNPLPYSISEMMTASHLSNYTRQRNIPVAAYFESKADEFSRLFGIDLIFFVDPLTRFNLCKFGEVVLEPVPDGISYNTATASRYGVRAAELINELIHARSNAEGEQ